MELREAIRGTGSVRTFTDQPVDDDTLAAVLDDARFAPSGGNRQGWRVAVVTDITLRSELAALMQAVWNEYRAAEAANGADTWLAPFAVIGADGTPTLPSSGEAATSAPFVPNTLLDHIAEIPVMLVVAADLRCIAMMDAHLDRVPLTGGASIYPFCWNLLLAARARGLGGVLTTFLARAEREAAGLVGLPPTHALAATIFLGHAAYQPTRLRRAPVESFTTRDRFDGDQFVVTTRR